MNEIIEKLKNKIDLTQDEVSDALKMIMEGDVDISLIKAFLLGLRDKGATVEEITGAAQLMRQVYLPVKTKHELIFDLVGTGGDKKHTFNISTLSSIVAASAGVCVAKHGNRSVSSKCGSADVLEALGVNLKLTPEQLGKCLDDIGIAFLFAQALHPAMKNVAPARKDLGVETIFNVLGPLLNPASATHQIMGVYDTKMVEPMVSVLRNLGSKRVMVVHGDDGMDEITTTTTTSVAEWDGNQIKTYKIDPKELGFVLSTEEDLKGGYLEENIVIARDILDGQKGPMRDVVILNSAAAFYVVGKADSIKDGIAIAEECIDSGKAKNKLKELIDYKSVA